MGIKQLTSDLWQLENTDEWALWLVDITDPASAGVRIDPWGEADDLVMSFRSWGAPQSVIWDATEVTGIWGQGRTIRLSSRTDHPDEAIPEPFEGLKITLHLDRANQIPNAGSDGKIRFAFDVLEGWDKYVFMLRGAKTQREIDEGAVVPNYAEHSIAIYHNTKCNHVTGQRNYKTGKAGHIYRPFIRDSLGGFYWGEWEVDEVNHKLVKAFPESAFNESADWWDVDEDIGQTSAGAAYGTVGTIRGQVKNASGNFLQPSISGTFTSVSLFMRNGSISVSGGIYDVDGGGEPDSLLDSGSATSIAYGGDPTTVNLGDDVSASSGVSYSPAFLENDAGYYYDQSGMTNAVLTYDNSTTPLPATWAGSNLSGYRLSIYYTVTESAGGTPLTATPADTNAASWSDTPGGFLTYAAQVADDVNA